jgi:hypothetical protein
MKGYEALVKHVQGCVKFLLKEMQRKSQSISEYSELCSRYETFQFDKLEEVELFYLMMKKHYLCKSFAAELSVKLESNKFAKTNTNSLSATSSLGPVSSSNSGASTSSSVPSRTSSPTMSSSYQNLSLPQVIHHELHETFFH